MIDPGICGRCGRPIREGQARMRAIPFIGSWGGFWHKYCPGRLFVVRHSEGDRDRPFQAGDPVEIQVIELGDPIPAPPPAIGLTLQPLPQEPA